MRVAVEEEPQEQGAEEMAVTPSREQLGRARPSAARDLRREEPCALDEGAQLGPHPCKQLLTQGRKYDTSLKPQALVLLTRVSPSAIACASQPRATASSSGRPSKSMALTTPSGLKRSNVARSSFVAKRQHAEALLQRGRRRGLVVDDPGPRSLALERGVRGVLGHLAAGLSLQSVKPSPRCRAMQV